MKTTTSEQFNNIIEFRQAIYNDGLTGYRDVQHELLDALLCGRRVHSYAELSLSPVMCRQWSSIYTGIRAGRQNRKGVRQLLYDQLPAEGGEVFALDTTVWPHPSAQTLENQVLEHSPAINHNRHQAVRGHVYSSLCWVPERGQSWALPVSTERVPPTRTATEFGLKQIGALRCWREKQGIEEPDIVVADAKYGVKFLAGCSPERIIGVTRLRADRVLYGPPGPYKGRGTKQRKHGDRFDFKDEESQRPADEIIDFVDERWGQVRLSVWHQLHAKQDAETVFSVIRVESRLERPAARRPSTLWLAYRAPDGYSPHALWLAFDHRWAIEPQYRFRKQRLHWTLPAFQRSIRCDRWTLLVDLAYWQLFLARDYVQPAPLPWQKPGRTLTPGQVLQAFAQLFAQLPTLTQPVKRRGIPPGWPKGVKRTRPKRYKVVRRGKR